MAFPLPPAIVASIISVTVVGLFALLGIIYSTLKSRISDNEVHTNEIDDRLDVIEKRVRTIFFWAFGNEKDATDQGFAHDIQHKLEALNEKLDRMDENESEHHEELVERLDELIIHLDDEDALDLDREDLK